MQNDRIKAINHHLRLALDQVGEGVAILEGGPLEGAGPRVVYSNRAMSDLVEAGSTSLAGQPLGNLTTPAGLNALMPALASAAQGAAADVDAPIYRPDGSGGIHRWTCTALTDGSGVALNYTVSVASLPAPLIVPVETAPAPAEVPAPAAEQAAAPGVPGLDSQADLVETIRDTARFVAHEFNNALTAILLPVQVAMRQVESGGDLHSRLVVAYESARQAAGLAKDFLDCFRPRPAVKECMKLDGLLGRAMRLATCAQNVEWALELAPDLLHAELDPNQIERVIFNLVRNACQAMPNGGQILVKAVNTFVQAGSVHALPPGPYIALTVRDWGPGIPEENLPHIFSSRFTTKSNGNGCGLPICHQIITEHGGEIHVKSRANVGTVFMIFLPAVEMASGAETEPPTTTPGAPEMFVPVAAPAPAPPTAPAPAPVAAPAALAPLEVAAPLAIAVPASEPVLAPVAVAEIAGQEPIPADFWTAPEPAPEPSAQPHVQTPQAVAARHAASPPSYGLAPGVHAATPVPRTVPVPLPGAVAEEAAASPGLTASDSEAIEENEPPSLLVVDDEDGVRRALSQIAQLMGFEVATAGTSDEALANYRTRLQQDRPYDSVLLDLNLRGPLNGFDVFQAIRRMDPEALVVATSGQHFEGDTERYLSLGFAGFLPKPYTLEQFDSVMREVLTP